VFGAPKATVLTITIVTGTDSVRQLNIVCLHQFFDLFPSRITDRVGARILKMRDLYFIVDIELQAGFGHQIVAPGGLNFHLVAYVPHFFDFFQF